MMDARHIGILLPILILTYSAYVIIRMSFCIRLRNFVVIKHRRTSDVISIFVIKFNLTKVEKWVAIAMHYNLRSSNVRRSWNWRHKLAWTCTHHCWSIIR